MNKVMYIMRGIPGSGKSTIARMLAMSVNPSYGMEYDTNPELVTIRSTDDQFMVDGKYMFDQTKLGGYHQKNVWLVEQDCKSDVGCVIVDNTNVKARDSKPYIALAKKYGYSVTIIRVDAGLVEAKKRNAGRSEDRKIPEHVLERMHGDMQNIDLDRPVVNDQY